MPGLRIIGTAKEKAGVLSFVLEGFRTEEVGAALNREGHCRALRPPLCPAHATPVRRRDDGSSVPGALQQLRRYRCFDRGALPPEKPGRLIQVWYSLIYHFFPERAFLGMPTPILRSVFSRDVGYHWSSSLELFV